MKWLTGKNAQAFADINWQPDEEENEVDVAGYLDGIEEWLRENSRDASFSFRGAMPVPQYQDTSFDGIRIFIKLLCDKSDYGFAVVPLVKANTSEAVSKVIFGLQRVVGSRGTQYLHSAAPVLRVRKPVEDFLNIFLRNWIFRCSGQTSIF